MGSALDAVTARDGQGFFEHCGYHVVAQLLLKTLQGLEARCATEVEVLAQHRYRSAVYETQAQADF
jgi:hypothetical protein